MKRAELVFVPMPGIGHLVSTMKFATQLLDRDSRFAITILVSRMPSDPIPLVGGLSDRHPSSDTIRYVHLPPVDPPPPEIFSKSREKYASAVTERYKPHIKTAIINHVLSANNAAPLAGLVIDLFFSSIIDVGRELGVPSYVFFTCSAAFLGLMFFLEARPHQIGSEFELEESNAELMVIPSFMHPVSKNVFPSFAFNEDGYRTMVTHAQNWKEAKGIIVNTFAELEPHAVSWLSRDGTAPSIYTVGPVLDLKSENRPSFDENQSRKSMRWLDDQPPSSVVFLCFGSWGSISAPQVREIARGLEKSGKRFLWSLRRPPRGDEVAWQTDSDYYKDVLPDGFVERMEGKGLLCGWVRQVDVLAHESIGGFVSHCGWNSILESIWHGVPLVAWPLYAEQQTNAFEVVKEMGLAVEMKMDFRRSGEDVVRADQVEKAVRCVMESDAEVRKKAKEMSEKSRKAVINGGSSYISLGKLITDIFSELS